MARLRIRLMPLVIMVICIMVIGTFFYSLLEGWNLIDSFYFTVMTLSTVGYGDLFPTTNATKLFTVAYVLIGVYIFFYTVKIFASYYFEKKRSGVSKAISQSFEHMIHKRKEKGDVVLKVKPVESKKST